MKENSYIALKNKQQKEINAFPMFFAYSNEQFKAGMKQIGLKPGETKKVCALVAGGYCRKTDRQKFVDMLVRHHKEVATAVAEDTTGEGFIREMFSYELANHEYCVTMDLTDTFEALDLTLEEVNSNRALMHGLVLAIQEQALCN